MLTYVLLAATTTLTLAQAESNAHANQPQLRFARANTEAQVARVGENRAFELPQVYGQLGYNRRTNNYAPSPNSPSFQDPNKPSPFTSYNNLNANLSGSQLLFDFFQTSSRVRSAEEQARAAQFGEAQSELDTQFAVRSAFFFAQGALASLQVAQENLASQDKHLALVQQLVDAGTRPTMDLFHAKQLRSDANFQVSSAKGTYENAKATLQQAMGINEAPGFEVSLEEFPAQPGENGTVEELLPEALKARPDIARLDAQLSSQQFTVIAAARGNLPSLSLQATVGDFGYSFSNQAWNAGIGLNLNWNFFNGMGTYASAREARAIIVQLEAQREQIVQQARVDVTQALVAIRTAREELAAATETRSYVKQRVEQAEARYAAGQLTAIELYDAQLGFRNASNAVAQATAALSVSRAQFAHALGRH